MARCHNCHKEIGYFSFWIGTFKHLGENFGRSKQLPISNCPHCGTACQETPGTAYTFLILIAALAFGFMQTIESLNIGPQNDILVISGIFIFVLIVGKLWWKFVSKLKAPS